MPNITTMYDICNYYYMPRDSPSIRSVHDVPCPTCGAGINEACADGRVHLERLDVAVRAAHEELRSRHAKP